MVHGFFNRRTADRKNGGPRYGLHGQRDRGRTHRRANRVPVVREEDPSRQVERIERPRPVEGARQQGEVRLGESLSPFEEAHGDEEIGKEGTPEFRHRDRIWHGGDGGERKDADRKSGGPRYPLENTSPPEADVSVAVLCRRGMIEADGSLKLVS